MKFISPMLASPLPKSFDPRGWYAEEKFDGHRLIVCVNDTQVKAWSRNGLERLLPRHVLADLQTLPNGTYDGELVTPGGRSYGVTDKTKAGTLIFVAFDILEVSGTPATHLTYAERRMLLVTALSGEHDAIVLADRFPLETMDDVKRIVSEVWKRDGEGLILKNPRGTYQPGKRSKDFIKIKSLKSAVLTVIGFQSGKMGPHATVVLEDEDGFMTTVKTLNTQELIKLNRDPKAAMGRKLRIEYQERTPDGSYRHPRWDRWENE